MPKQRFSKHNWLFAVGLDDDNDAEFFVRTAPPRCLVKCKINVTRKRFAPISVSNDFCEEFWVVQWFDPEPDKKTHRAILREARDANEVVIEWNDLDAMDEGELLRKEKMLVDAVAEMVVQSRPRDEKIH
jgi:hypothetical protein